MFDAFFGVRRGARSFAPALVACLGMVWGGGLCAHQISAVAAKAEFGRDGTFRFALSLEASGSADPALNELISPEEAALEYLREALEFQFDGQAFSPAFGPLREVHRDDPFQVQGDLTELHTEAAGQVPPGAAAFQVRLSPETDVALVMVIVKDGITQRRAQTVFAGEVSRPVDLTFIGQEVRTDDPFAAEALAERPVPGLEDGVRGGVARMLAGSGRRVLVVFAMLLLGATAWQAGAQAGLFWVAGFGGHWLIRASGLAVTPLLANWMLGIALLGLAADNVARSRAGGVRHAVAGAAGFLLGMATRDVAFEAAWPALAGFHAGKLLVILGVAIVLWIALGPFQGAAWYHRRIVVPISLVLAGSGLFWMVSGFLTAP